MANTGETETVEEAPEPAPAPRRMGPMLLMIAGIAGGGLGGLAGAYLIAPRLAGKAAPAAATAEAAPAATAPADGDGSAKKPTKAAGPPHIYRIDNVIVNPAGSDGTRFLMASVAYEVPDDAAEQALHAREVELRDDVVSVLETKTMGQLTQPHARDTLKTQLLDIAHHVLGPQMQIGVYLPQFVIQ